MNPTQSPTNPHAAGKAAHTPTPWSVRASRNDEGYGLLICDEDQTILAGMDTWLGPTPEAEMEANAAFIVRACNSHEALLAFAKTFALWDSKGIIKTLAPYEGNEGGLRELARAALQSANLEAAQ